MSARFGALIIGDEILRGKRQDRHFAKVVELLEARGLSLDWAHYLGDVPPQIVETLRRSFASGDIVFSFGGIGATPDDHTRQCAATALELPLELHPEAAPIIREAILKRFGSPASENQLLMGTYPQGAQIIPNPYNGIPGFSIRHHHFVPGFPVMAHPMIEWVLDKHYAHLHHQRDEAEASLYVYGLTESAVTPLMEEVERAHPGIKTFSLPHVGDALWRRHIELGVRGSRSQVEAAANALRVGVSALGGEFRVDGPLANSD